MRAVVLGMVVTMVLLLSSCPQAGGGGGEQGGGGGGFQMPPTPVIVEPVVLVDYAPAIELVGEVRATQRAVLSAEIGGRVTRVAHRLGEQHPRSAGALIQLNTADYAAMLQAAQGGLSQAREALLMAENGPRAQDIAAQQAQVAAARAQYDLALDNLGRQQELFEQGVISESMMIAAETQAEAARAALEAQHEILDSLQEGTRGEQLEQARAMVQIAESQVSQAELALAKTSIAPPFDAVVTNLMVEVGSMVGPGTPVVEVVAVGPGEAWFSLPEGDVTRVHPGDMVELTFDALPELTVTGSVISVAAAADPVTRQFPIRVAINDDGPLPGMVAYGRILTATPLPTVMISRDAAVLDKLGMVVYMMVPPADGAAPPMEGMPPLPTVSPVYVELGDTFGDLVVVTKGELQPGMMIVTRGNEQLYMGANIIPTNLMGEGGMGGGAPGGPEGVPEATPEGMPDGAVAPGEMPGDGAPVQPDSAGEGGGA